MKVKDLQYLSAELRNDPQLLPYENQNNLNLLLLLNQLNSEIILTQLSLVHLALLLHSSIKPITPLHEFQSLMI